MQLKPRNTLNSANGSNQTIKSQSQEVKHQNSVMYTSEQKDLKEAQYPILQEFWTPNENHQV